MAPDAHQMRGRKASAKITFAKKRLADYPLPTAGRVYVYDEGCPNLACCLTSTESRVFYVVKKVNGSPQRIRLGSFPEITIDQARTLARAITGDIARGVDPMVERRKARDVPTVKELFDRWLETYAKHHRKTWKDDQRQFNKYLADFHGRRLNAVQTSEVAGWHTRAGEEYGHYQANRVLELLQTLYNRAKEVMGFECPNPCASVRPFKEEQRDRFLQAEELRPFFDAVNQEEPTYRDFFMVALLTGARRSNVQEMAWDDVHWQAQIWRIPETKAGVPVVVPLSEPAMEILKRRYADHNGSPWVFPAPSRTGHLMDPRKAWLRVLKRSGLSDLRMHDLRRSLGSWQAITGASLPIIGKSLGHTDQTATAIYARLTVDPVRASVNKATVAMIEAGKKKEGGDNGTQTE